MRGQQVVRMTSSVTWSLHRIDSFPTMGTNNPTDEQLELVESRIIALADTIVDPGLPLEADSYFDEHGFDLESAAGQLSAKLKLYCKDAEGVEPSLEDHPQVRRMARYLLENVDYDILSAELSSELLSSKPAAAGGGGGAIAAPDTKKMTMIVGAILLVLALCAVLYFFVFSGGAKAAEGGIDMSSMTGGGRGGRGGGRAHRFRNGSA